MIALFILTGLKKVPQAHEKKALRQQNFSQEQIDAPDGMRTINLPNHGLSVFPDGTRLLCFFACGFMSQYHHDALLASEVIFL